MAERSSTRAGLAAVKAGLHGAEPEEDSEFLAASAACTRGAGAGAMARRDAGSACLLRTVVGRGTGSPTDNEDDNEDDDEDEDDDE